MINIFLFFGGFFSLVCRAACGLQGQEHTLMSPEVVETIQERVRVSVGPTQSLINCNSQATMVDRERIRHLETSRQVDAEPVHVCVGN